MTKTGKALGATILTAATITGGVAAQKQCNPADAQKLCAACAVDATLPGCKEAYASGLCQSTSPSPSPSTSTSPEPTPSPTASAQPTPEATPTPTPNPTPTPGHGGPDPYPIPPGAGVKITIGKLGNGYDSTILLVGVPDFCREHGWTDGRANCPPGAEGDPRRKPGEILIAGGCPVWQGECYSMHPNDYECPITFSHFDHDDPQTPQYEGANPECQPESGFWVIAEGRGRVRACTPNGKSCSNWMDVDY